MYFEFVWLKRMSHSFAREYNFTVTRVGMMSTLSSPACVWVMETLTDAFRVAGTIVTVRWLNYFWIFCGVHTCSWCLPTIDVLSRRWWHSFKKCKLTKDGKKRIQKQELATKCKGQTICQMVSSNWFIRFAKSVHKQKRCKKRAHKKDCNHEPFVENETTNKRVHKKRFTNPLLTTDVLGHNSQTFFEKVLFFRKGSQLRTFSSRIQMIVSHLLGSFQKGPQAQSVRSCQLLCVAESSRKKKKQQKLEQLTWKIKAKRIKQKQFCGFKLCLHANQKFMARRHHWAMRTSLWRISNVLVFKKRMKKFVQKWLTIVFRLPLFSICFVLLICQ